MVERCLWFGLSQLGISTENGKFMNISMGQGQEKPAEAAVASYARDGGWLMLQNVHLMQSWLPVKFQVLRLGLPVGWFGHVCALFADSGASTGVGSRNSASDFPLLHFRRTTCVLVHEEYARIVDAVVHQSVE
jgi:hypothetical protein